MKQTLATKQSFEYEKKLKKQHIILTGTTQHAKGSRTERGNQLTHQEWVVPMAVHGLNTYKYSLAQL